MKYLIFLILVLRFSLDNCVAQEFNNQIFISVGQGKANGYDAWNNFGNVNVGIAYHRKIYKRWSFEIAVSNGNYSYGAPSVYSDYRKLEALHISSQDNNPFSMMNPDFNKIERIGLIDLHRGEMIENFTILNTNLFLSLVQNENNNFGVGGGALLGYGTVMFYALSGPATISSKELKVTRKKIKLTSYLQHRTFDWGYEVNFHYKRKISENLWLGAQWISGELWESVNTYHKINISLGIDF